MAFENVFPGGGEMGELIRSHPWATTPLGPIDTWPSSLKTALRLLLSSRYPMFLWWGPDLTMFHNDAYIPVLGEKHPSALGGSAAQVWSEIWPDLSPFVDGVFHRGESSFSTEMLLMMERSGFREETYFTFSYSPAPDDGGGVGGLFCACTEDTAQVLSRRRLRTLGALANLATQASVQGSGTDACAAAMGVLAQNREDIPFSSVALLEREGNELVRAGFQGLPSADTITPSRSRLGDDTAPWPFARVLENRSAEVVRGAWNDAVGHTTSPPGHAVDTAYVVPLTVSENMPPLGVLVLGCSPHRPFDEDMREYFNLVGRQVSGLISSARAFEQEKRRAETLAALDHAKTRFFSNISHEFRTPLTLMLGPLEDLLAHAADSPLGPHRPTLETALRNARRLLKLVNTLLDFSRIEAGRMQARFERLDLCAFTTDLASLFRSATQSAGLALEIRCGPVNAPVWVDRAMWENIVVNLLSNAFKYTHKGGIELAIEERGSEDGGRVALIIRDTGTGIPPEDMPHLFDRFHRAAGTLGRSHEGTGIGLSFVKELVRLHQGTIEVDSTLGRGTTVTVAIPTGSAHLPQDQLHTGGHEEQLPRMDIPMVSWVHETSQGDAPKRFNGDGSDLGAQEHARTDAAAHRWNAPTLQPSPPSPFSPNLRSEPQRKPRILIVEDNADMRTYLARILTATGEILSVGDGQEALDVIARTPPDLVLTDVMMPRLDGFGLVAALRNSAATRHLPVIMLSARSGEESTIEGLHAGADDYLPKPFSARELLARVRTHLELQRSRRESTESRAQLQAVLSRAPIIVWAFDAQGTAVQAEGQLLSAYFPAPEQARSQRTGAEPEACAFLFKPLSHASRIYQTLGIPLDEVSIQRALAGESFSRTYENHGQSIETLYIPTPHHPSAGAPVLIAISTDISERILFRTHLRESEAYFRRLVDTSPAILWVTDAEGRCTYLSQKWYDQTGGTPESDLGFGWLERTHPDDRARTEKAFKDANESHGPLALDYRLRQNDGSYRWSLDMAHARHDDAGAFQGYVGTVFDVHERTLALAGLERAVRVRDEFLATLSHELRTPMNVILGWLQVMGMPGFDLHEIGPVVKILERNCKLQVQLIEDLLDVSRIINGRMSLEPTAVDLVQVARAGVDTVMFAAQAKGVHVSFETASPHLPVTGDPNRLQQVVWNLVSNAVKFTPKGGRVEVSLAAHGARNQLRVKDTGQGIEKQFLPHVFERFRQEDSSTTRRTGGLGLGLAIVRHITELHGGQVSVESEGRDRGATFIVEMPMRESDMAAVESRSGGTEGRAGTSTTAELKSAPLQGVNLLVVDDSADVRDLLLSFLRREGADVESAAGATEALHAIERRRPDLIVSDIGMPDEDGYMFLRRLREREKVLRLARTPAIALTAYARAEEAQEALASGFQRHVPKPIFPPELTRHILEVLSEPPP